MNKVILCGRFTRDPESRMGANSLEVSRFSLACQCDFLSKDGQRETEFINCVAFGRTAQTINKFCQKGRMILATGRIRNSSYDAQDGTKRYSTDVVVDNFEFVGSSKGNEGVQSSSSNSTYSNFNNNSNMQTADLSEDPYKEFSEETSISSDEFPF